MWFLPHLNLQNPLSLSHSAPFWDLRPHFYGCIGFVAPVLSPSGVVFLVVPRFYDLGTVVLCEESARIDRIAFCLVF